MSASPHPDDAWCPVRQGLADRAHEALVGLILDGSLQPGLPLRIGPLARRLGVSATPVREALVHMSASGLVVRENNKGFRVAPRPTATELDHLFEARLTLEVKIAQLASAHADEGLRSALTDALEAQRRCGAGTSLEDFRGFLDGDRLFHGALATAADNQYLSSALNSLDVHVQRYRSFDDTVVTDREETLHEHQAILDAVMSGDARAAELAMTLHLSRLRRRVSEERRGAR